ncbi:hypothetical protein ET475_13595 [Microbacterium protaetiae]|uniref:Uncharacterized protein n=1 Tax=Microbacterium protaetiae TaxID=2509458 RepID=A0A4P6EI55_9MICO|nr:hypothetical protein [Microbacterium protaetiae]QAY60919.1 hypothetical protein ET475_13595 [Microbacterium protaetiae]
MDLTVEQLIFQDGSIAEFSISYRMMRGGAALWGAHDWVPFERMETHGDPISRDLIVRQGGMSFGWAGEGYRSGMAVLLRASGATHTSSPVVAAQRVEVKVDTPSVDAYQRVLEDFEAAMDRPDLESAGSLQMSAFELMQQPDWLQWRSMFVDAYGRRVPFLRAKGRRVAALYWTDERREFAEKAIEAVGDKEAFSIADVAELAVSLDHLRRLVHAENVVPLASLSRRLREVGVSRPKELANWLRDNREVHFEGKMVCSGPEPSLLPQRATVPPFKKHHSSRDDMNDEQRRFYDEVAVRAFEAFRPVDLDGSISYGFAYLYGVVREHAERPTRTRSVLEWFSDTYSDSSLGRYAVQWLADLSYIRGDFARGVEVHRRIGLPLDIYLALAQPLGLRLVASDVRAWLAADPGLTQTGMFMRDDVDDGLQHVLDEFHDANGRSVVEDWWHRLAIQRRQGEPAPLVEDELLGFMCQSDVDMRIGWADHGAHLYDRARMAFRGVLGYNAEIPWPDRYPNCYWYGELIWARLRAAYRLAENRVRESKGLARVGEGWVSEVALLNAIREAFPNERVVHQGRPKWLKPQSLDIFLPDRKVGIEYQGVQHSQPVGRFGGDVAFVSQQTRDARKRRLCAENSCQLIEVHPDYDRDRVLAQIRQALAS